MTPKIMFHTLIFTDRPEEECRKRLQIFATNVPICTALYVYHKAGIFTNTDVRDPALQEYFYLNPIKIYEQNLKKKLSLSNIQQNII